MEKECKHHGLTEHALHVNGRVKCKKCNVEAVMKSKRSIKDKAIDHKGGSCEICEYNKCNEALEFHHLDPNAKDFGIGDGNYRSWRKVKIELDKCIMVCANCHREVHAGLIEI